VHTIPKNTTVEQVKEDLTQRFAGTDFHIELHPYHCEKYKDQFFAVVRTSLEGLKNVAKAKSIRVGWVKCRIDSSIHVSRCSRCGLLGHSVQRYSLMEGAATPSADCPEEACKDCCHFNKTQQEMGKTTGVRPNHRDTQHKTGSSQCPTLIAFKKEALPLRAARTGADNENTK